MSRSVKFEIAREFGEIGLDSFDNVLYDMVDPDLLDVVGDVLNAYHVDYYLYDGTGVATSYFLYRGDGVYE